jgi:hypothetical protein
MGMPMATSVDGFPTIHLQRASKKPGSKDPGFFARPSFRDGTIADPRANMVSPNVHKIFQDMLALNDAERQQLQDLLEHRAARQSGQPAREQEAFSQDELAAALAKKGIRLTVPPRRTAEEIARFQAWQPVHMPGGSLSDQLIRDRR